MTIFDEIPLEAQERIHQAIIAGQKIVAIKIYRDATGSSLLDAKSIVEGEIERLRNNAPSSVASPETNLETDHTDQILELIFTRQKLAAVKLHARTSGMSLMEAKKFIEDLTDELLKECPGQFRESGNSEIQIGCAGPSVLLIAIGLAAIACGL